jgi:hypothetical protein
MNWRKWNKYFLLKSKNKKERKELNWNVSIFEIKKKINWINIYH